jgi:hypothetical protein
MQRDAAFHRFFTAERGCALVVVSAEPHAVLIPRPWR